MNRKEFIPKTLAGIVAAITLGSGCDSPLEPEEQVNGIITWEYKDDFSTRKAESDSYDHTRFVSIYSYTHPGLCYWPKRDILLFAGLRTPVFLAYAFPLDNILTRVNSGTFELDVFFNKNVPQSFYELQPFYELSKDGVNWTKASPLVENHNQIPLLASDNPFTYIKLSGNGVSIDNLSVIVRGLETQVNSNSKIKDNIEYYM